MHKVTILVLFLQVALTWGTTWLAMRIAAETIPPVFATGMRFMFAAPFLISIAWLRKIPILFPPGQRLFQLVICVFYFAIPFSLMIYGETYVSSGLASLFSLSSCPWTMNTFFFMFNPASLAIVVNPLTCSVFFILFSLTECSIIGAVL